MDLALVMDAIAEQLKTIAAFRAVYEYPPSSATAPAAVVSYPDQYEFDATYQRGMDRMTLPVVVVVGKPSDKATRELMAAFCNGSGQSSVKQVLEAGRYTVFDVVRVTSIDFDVITVGTADYLAAVFNLDIAGQGS